MDAAGAIDVGVISFHRHVRGGVEENRWRGKRVTLDEPDRCGDVVDDVAKDDWDGSFRLEEVDGATIVVGKGGGLRVEGRVGFDEGDKMLPDEPLGLLGVGKGSRAAL